jgi:[ribosomal protein S18]-alanine N-acetyltransferase
MEPKLESTSSLRLRPLRLRDARAMARWRYNGAYAFYNFGQVAPRLLALFQPLLRYIGAGYYAVEGAPGDLVGVFSFHKQASTVTIGLGMRPDLTGQGGGLEFVRAGLAFGREQYAPEVFRLTVASFNRRAIRVYERAGFVSGRRFIQPTNRGPQEFIEMTRPASVSI